MSEERIGKCLVVRDGLKSANRPSWSVVNNSEQYLGSVEYFPRWWQYVFIVADSASIFSVGCMEDIVAFVKKQNAALRQKKQASNQETIRL